MTNKETTFWKADLCKRLKKKKRKVDRKKFRSGISSTLGKIVWDAILKIRIEAEIKH